MCDSVLARTAAVLGTALLVACAFAERFGAGGDDDQPGTGCSANADCYDGNPLTADLCSADGTCVHPVNPPDTDPPSTDPVDVCNIDAEVGESTLVTVVLDAVPGALSHSLPLVQGRVVHLSLRDRQQLRILPADKPDDGLLLVLLSGCANAAVNRLAWGGDVTSPYLDEGEYYLAVFSAEPRTVVLDVRYLEPVTCEDAEPLPEGKTAGTVDGYGDGFSGSCLPSVDAGLRGDRVYAFGVPEGETRDLLVHLYTEGEQPGHYLFLRRGCGGPEAVEIACESEGVQVPADGEAGTRGETIITLTAQGLAPGVYALFVDAAVPDVFELGEYHVEAFFSAQR